jgi:adenylate cyclase class IV
MENVEFKAELRDYDLARTLCAAQGATFICVLDQTDTYYRLPSGRLKKRETVGDAPEYIFYERENQSRPRLSRFTIYSESEALARFGATPLPVWVVVRKKRTLYLLGGVRIHLDDVEGLGRFIEFEAIVSAGQSVARCHEAVAALRRALAPVIGEPVSMGYSDLVAANADAPADT